MKNIKPVNVSDLDEKSMQMLVGEFSKKSLFELYFLILKQRIYGFFGKNAPIKTDLYWKIKTK